MPPKKETASEKAARFRDMAMKLRLKGALARVTGVLRPNGQKLLEVETELVTLGILEPEAVYSPPGQATPGYSPSRTAAPSPGRATTSSSTGTAIHGST